MTARGMTEAEKYLFDVHGYLVIEGLLSPEEVAAANAAVDSRAGQIQIRPCDLANGSRTLEGSQGRGDQIPPNATVVMDVLIVEVQ